MTLRNLKFPDIIKVSITEIIGQSEFKKKKKTRVVHSKTAFYSSCDTKMQNLTKAQNDAATYTFPANAKRTLESMFNLVTSGIHSDQSSPCEFLALFASFLRDWKIVDNCHTAQLLEAEKALWLLALNRSDSVQVQFCESYGCVILAISSFGSNSELTSHLHVLGPDEWAFGVVGNQFISVPRSECFVDLVAGTIPQNQLTSLFEKIQLRLD